MHAASGQYFLCAVTSAAKFTFVRCSFSGNINVTSDLLPVAAAIGATAPACVFSGACLVKGLPLPSAAAAAAAAMLEGPASAAVDVPASSPSASTAAWMVHAGSQ